jgi:branched-chain amino acid transport system ATP-binding protein
VFGKLREVREAGITVLLVEQNVKAALGLADRAAVLVEGKERIVGSSAELLGDARIAALYLGRHAGTMAAGRET